MFDVQAERDHRLLTMSPMCFDRRESLRMKIRQVHRAGARGLIHQ
jgi:hypothetical protein